MGERLTLKQKEVLDLVRNSIDQNGYAPSLTEMMEELGLSTKRSVAFHLDALEKKGMIYRTGEARGIRLIQNNTGGGFIPIPLLGFANCGEALMVAEEEDNGEILVEETILKGKRKVFGVELRGDSMDQRRLNGINLANGNFAIVVKEEEVRTGDVVLAIIEGGATIKSFKREKGMIVLYPESSNPRHKPIYVKESDMDSAMIAGKVLTVLSNPSTEEAVA